MAMQFRAEDSFLLLVDVQEALAGSIWEMDRVMNRCHFLLESARELGVPIVVTEQNPERMGRTVAALSAFASAPHAKMAFSAYGCEACVADINALDRTQAIVIGIETHICVSQTAHDLLRSGFEVAVCPDAVSARNTERHKLGMERIRDAGIMPAHTESVVYEWLGSASHAKFRDVLKIVKEHP